MSVRQAIDKRSVVEAYLGYDIQLKKIENGWGHPAVLHAIAMVRHPA